MHLDDNVTRCEGEENLIFCTTVVLPEDIFAINAQRLQQRPTRETMGLFRCRDREHDM